MVVRLNTSGQRVHSPEVDAELIEIDVLLRGTIVPAIKDTINVTKRILRKKQVD